VQRRTLGASRRNRRTGWAEVRGKLFSHARREGAGSKDPTRAEGEEQEGRRGDQGTAYSDSTPANQDPPRHSEGLRTQNETNDSKLMSKRERKERGV